MSSDSIPYVRIITNCGVLTMMQEFVRTDHEFIYTRHFDSDPEEHETRWLLDGREKSQSTNFGLHIHEQDLLDILRIFPPGRSIQ